MRLRPICFILILFFFIPGITTAEFYKYRDQNGVLRFTDNLVEIPVDQRPKVVRYGEDDDGLTYDQKVEKAQKEAEKIKEQEAFLRKQAKLQSDFDPRKRLDELQKTKTELDQEHAGLTEQKKSLLTDKRRNSNNSAEVNAYNVEVNQLNAKIKAFEKKRNDYEEKLNAYNQWVKKQ